MSHTSTPLDVLAIGRSGVDIYPLQVGVGLEDVQTFGKFLGGSPMNVAVAVARMGHRAGMITAVGDDPFGRFVRAEMRRLGVDDSFVVTIEGINTPVTFCEIFPPNDFPLYFYRDPSTPDLQIRAIHIPSEHVRSARIFWLSTSGLCAEPVRSAHHVALQARADGQALTSSQPRTSSQARTNGQPRTSGQARASGQASTGGMARADAGLEDGGAHEQRWTILDLDYRPKFWPSAHHARQEIRAVLPYCNVAIGNLDECRLAVGCDSADEAADALLECGVQIAVVKQGLEGTLAKTSTERVFVPSTPVTTLNGLGAGDAFGGSFCHALLEGWDVERAVRFASTAGAIVASRLECSTAMPTQWEVEHLMRSTSAEGSEATTHQAGPTHRASSADHAGPTHRASSTDHAGPTHQAASTQHTVLTYQAAASSPGASPLDAPAPLMTTQTFSHGGQS